MAVYNRIYSKEKWEKVLKSNKAMMEDFLLEMRSQKKKEGTISQYKNDIRILLIFILEDLNNKSLEELKKRDFRNYSLWLQDKGMSSSRVNRMLSALRSMLAFAEDDDEYDIEINYAQKVKGLTKEPVRDIIFLTMEEVMVIYNRLIKEENYQQALLCALFIDTAGRRNEVFQVKKSSITEDGNLTNEVIGKRGKKFKLLYNDLTKEAFKLYMEQRGEDDIDSLWVIKTKDDIREASLESLYSWVIGWRKIIEEEIGEYKPFNPHAFRHSSLELLNNGEHYLCKKLNRSFSLEELKLLANHENLDTTSGYLQNKDTEVLLSAFGLI